MNSELSTRQPAHVVRSELLDATARMTLLGTEVIACQSRHQLVAMISKAERKGEMRRIGSPQWNADHQTWDIRVRYLKDPAPAWVKPAVIVGAATALAGVLVGLLVWLFTALAAVPWAAIAGGGLVGLIAVRLVARRSITVIQQVTIK